MDPIYLSPHFDDAVLSCGGQIFGDVALGRRPRVVTLFAGIPRPDEVWPFAAVQHRMWGSPRHPILVRRAEDRAALAWLGIPPDDVLHLDERDAVYRGSVTEAFYGAEGKIFGEVHLAEQEFPAQLAQTLAALAGPREAVRFVAPLGAGGHVDHQLTHLAAHELLRAGWNVAWYEELPYVFDSAKQAAALADKQGWTVETIPLDEGAMAAKVTALSYYRSQIPVLFGDDLRMSQRVRAYAATVAPDGAPYGERRFHAPDECSARSKGDL